MQINCVIVFELLGERQPIFTIVAADRVRAGFVIDNIPRSVYKSGIIPFTSIIPYLVQCESPMVARRYDRASAKRTSQH